MQQAFAPIRALIHEAGLEPYDVAQRCGELKFVLLTYAEHSGEFGLRFVLRSKQFLAALQVFEVKQIGVCQMRGYDVLQCRKHGFDSAGEFFVPIIEQVFDDLALQVGL